MKHLAWLLLPLLLAACGQKGALYFPDQKPAHQQHEQTAPASSPSHANGYAE